MTDRRQSTASVADADTDRVADPAQSDAKDKGKQKLKDLDDGSSDAGATGQGGGSSSQTPPPRPNADWARKVLTALNQKQADAAAASGTTRSKVKATTLQGGTRRAEQRKVTAPKGAGLGRMARMPLLGPALMELFGQPEARRTKADLDGTIDAYIQDLRENGSSSTQIESDEELIELRKTRDRYKRIDDQRAMDTACKVEVTGADGRTLSGNFFSADSQKLAGKPDLSKPVVLYLSGSGGTAEDYGTDVAEFYQDSGASVLAVNYGGYGDSTAMDPSEKSLLEDGQAMLEYLRDLGYPDENIILHGYSMGGAVAGKLQAHNEAQDVKLRGLVLDRPMLSSTAGVKGKVGSASNNPTVKAGVTRFALGSLSARKAIMGQDSDTRMVVTSDEVTIKDETGKGKSWDFAQSAEDFRAKLRARIPDTNAGKGAMVTGSASGGKHFDHQAMIASNKGAMEALVKKPRTGDGDQGTVVAPTGSDDPGAKTAAWLQRELDRSITDLVKRVDSGKGMVRAYLDASPALPTDDASRKRLAVDLASLQEKIDEWQETASVFDATTGSATLPGLTDQQAGKLIIINGQLKSLSAQLAKKRFAAGVATTVRTGDIDIVLKSGEAQASEYDKVKGDSAKLPSFLSHFIKNVWPPVGNLLGLNPDLTDDQQKLANRLTAIKAAADADQAAKAGAVKDAASGGGFTKGIVGTSLTRSTSGRGLLGSRRPSVEGGAAQ